MNQYQKYYRIAFDLERLASNDSIAPNLHRFIEQLPYSFIITPLYYYEDEDVEQSEKKVQNGEATAAAAAAATAALSKKTKRSLNGSFSSLGAPFQKDDLLYGSMDWSSFVVGRLTSARRVLAAATATTTLNSDALAIAERQLNAECSFASHLNLPALLLPPLRSWSTESVSALACAVASARASYGGSFWLEVKDANNVDDWQMYNIFRTLCGGAAVSLFVALRATEEAAAAHAAAKAAAAAAAAATTTATTTMSATTSATTTAPGLPLLHQWLGEPIRALILPTNLFLCNSDGFPVLSTALQAMVQEFMRLEVAVVVRRGVDDAVDGDQSMIQLDDDVSLSRYHEYLARLCSQPPPPPAHLLPASYHFCAPYFDTLQAPLQPLMDHLSGQTYETFEKDTVKYDTYERAVKEALKELAPLKRREQAAIGVAESFVVVAVVGAGRGPLVRATIRAATALACNVRIYALDKNPNAVMTLQALKRAMEWSDELVRVVGDDMRRWKAPERADLLVSELLGSFGDNEAAPECIRGALRLLRRDGLGHCIPQRYSSFLAPLSSARLHAEAKALAHANFGATSSTEAGSAAHLRWCETPYVVAAHNATELTRAQLLFEFNDYADYKQLMVRMEVEGVNEHDEEAFERLVESLPTHARYASRRFQSPTPSLVHGFIGYFEAHLFNDVTLSILPSSHTFNMTSWFPIYFPLRTPTTIDAAQPLHVQLWRRATPTKLWYEWSLTAPVATEIHNQCGRSYFIGL